MRNALDKVMNTTHVTIMQFNTISIIQPMMKVLPYGGLLMGNKSFPSLN